MTLAAVLTVGPDWRMLLASFSSLVQQSPFTMSTTKVWPERSCCSQLGTDFRIYFLYGSPKSYGGLLNYLQPMLISDSVYGIHAGALPIQAGRHNSFGVAVYSVFDLFRVNIVMYPAQYSRIPICLSTMRSSHRWQ